MSSDASYERLVKLWISLWALVLESKRHMETVCALLQRLVFEKQGWPRYKNWAAICELGHRDHLLMMIVATFDLTRTDKGAQQIIAAFPQCFSDKEIQGPIPLSLIREKAIEGKRKAQSLGERGTSAELGGDFPASYGALKSFNLPILEFRTSQDTVAPELPMLPGDITWQFKQGKIVKWHGRRFVIVENNQNPGVNIMTLVPAECIDVAA